MAKHIVKCRYCNESFDTTSLVEGIDWVKPKERTYYHKVCYDKKQIEEYNKKITPKSQKNNKDPEIEQYWKEIAEFFSKDLKVEPKWSMARVQYNNCIKKGFRPKGIFLTLKYFYEVRRGNWEKSNGGIGIVESIYDEAREYWEEQESIKQRILISAKAQEEMRKNIIKIKPGDAPHKKIKETSWEEIENSIDE